MIYGIYAIRDIKSEYMRILSTEPNNEVAISHFIDMFLNYDNLALYAHPADFDFYRVGSWDSESGIVTGCQSELMITGVAARHQAGKIRHGFEADMDRGLYPEDYHEAPGNPETVKGAFLSV